MANERTRDCDHLDDMRLLLNHVAAKVGVPFPV